MSPTTLCNLSSLSATAVTSTHFQFATFNLTSAFFFALYPRIQGRVSTQSDRRKKKKITNILARQVVKVFKGDEVVLKSTRQRLNAAMYAKVCSRKHARVERAVELHLIPRPFFAGLLYAHRATEATGPEAFLFLRALGSTLENMLAVFFVSR